MRQRIAGLGAISLAVVLAVVACCAVDIPGVPGSAPVRVDAPVEYPTVNLPVGLRQYNWLGPWGQGSCVHATTVMLFRWQGWPAMADWWRRNMGDGEWPADLAQKFDRAGVKFSETVKGDVSFLDWALRTRRGAGVVVDGGAHMILLVHLDDKYAATIDNNDPANVRWWNRGDFISHWQSSGGWAFSVHYWPAPPLPSYQPS